MYQTQQIKPTTASAAQAEAAGPASVGHGSGGITDDEWMHIISQGPQAILEMFKYMKHENEQLTDENARLNTVNGDLKDENEHFKNVIVNLNTGNDDLEHKVIVLTIENGRLKKLTDHYGTVNRDLWTDVHDLKTEVEELNKEVAYLLRFNEGLMDERSELELNIDELEGKMATTTLDTTPAVGSKRRRIDED